MLPDKEFIIRLNGFDLGQLLDGLEARATAWRHTAEYMETGEAPEGFMIEECTDAEEARKIAGHYERILGTILQQQAEQHDR
ncbi:MAG: hypothetical protein J5I62_11180 [Flavobacteriales bacterium]|nr:hypothetical protein [Flavobacteriales bacterium]